METKVIIAVGLLIVIVAGLLLYRWIQSGSTEGTSTTPVKPPVKPTPSSRTHRRSVSTPESSRRVIDPSRSLRTDYNRQTYKPKEVSHRDEESDEPLGLSDLYRTPPPRSPVTVKADVESESRSEASEEEELVIESDVESDSSGELNRDYEAKGLFPDHGKYTVTPQDDASDEPLLSEEPETEGDIQDSAGPSDKLRTFIPIKSRPSIAPKPKLGPEARERLGQARRNLLGEHTESPSGDTLVSPDDSRKAIIPFIKQPLTGKFGERVSPDPESVLYFKDDTLFQARRILLPGHMRTRQLGIEGALDLSKPILIPRPIVTDDRMRQGKQILIPGFEEPAVTSQPVSSPKAPSPRAPSPPVIVPSVDPTPSESTEEPRIRPTRSQPPPSSPHRILGGVIPGIQFEPSIPSVAIIDRDPAMRRLPPPIHMGPEQPSPWYDGSMSKPRSPYDYRLFGDRMGWPRSIPGPRRGVLPHLEDEEEVPEPIPPESTEEPVGPIRGLSTPPPSAPLDAESGRTEIHRRLLSREDEPPIPSPRAPSPRAPSPPLIVPSVDPTPSEPTLPESRLSCETSPAAFKAVKAEMNATLFREVLADTIAVIGEKETKNAAAIYEDRLKLLEKIFREYMQFVDTHLRTHKDRQAFVTTCLEDYKGSALTSRPHGSDALNLLWKMLIESYDTTPVLPDMTELNHELYAKLEPDVGGITKSGLISVKRAFSSIFPDRRTFDTDPALNMDPFEYIFNLPIDDKGVEATKYKYVEAIEYKGGAENLILELADLLSPSLASVLEYPLKLYLYLPKANPPYSDARVSSFVKDAHRTMRGTLTTLRHMLFSSTPPLKTIGSHQPIFKGRLTPEAIKTLNRHIKEKTSRLTDILKVSDVTLEPSKLTLDESIQQFIDTRGDEPVSVDKFHDRIYIRGNEVVDKEIPNKVTRYYTVLPLDDLATMLTDEYNKAAENFTKLSLHDQINDLVMRSVPDKKTQIPTLVDRASGKTYEFLTGAIRKAVSYDIRSGKPKQFTKILRVVTARMTKLEDVTLNKSFIEDHFDWNIEYKLALIAEGLRKLGERFDKLIKRLPSAEPLEGSGAHPVKKEGQKIPSVSVKAREGRTAEKYVRELFEKESEIVVETFRLFERGAEVCNKIIVDRLKRPDIRLLDETKTKAFEELETLTVGIYDRVEELDKEFVNVVQLPYTSFKVRQNFHQLSALHTVQSLVYDKLWALIQKHCKPDAAYSLDVFHKDFDDLYIDQTITVSAKDAMQLLDKTIMPISYMIIDDEVVTRELLKTTTDKVDLIDFKMEGLNLRRFYGYLGHHKFSLPGMEAFDRLRNAARDRIKAEKYTRK